jgi:4-amino-4-deoxy-L-arabinose transferase-like glycosyltransferase
MKDISLALARPLNQRIANLVLLIILAIVGAWSVFHAIIKPFWFDEMCTLIVSRSGSLAQMWDALKAAADSNPPVYYALTRLAHGVIPDEHIAYRLPSIVGLILVIASLYVGLSSKVDRWSALVGATFVICTPLASYSYEARPYALMLGTVSIAIAAWLHAEKSRVYPFMLAMALGLAVSLHYWAMLVWAPFGLAEAAFFLVHRRLRIRVWLALAAGAIPLLLWRPLMTSLRQYYSDNFWARPSLMQVFESHNWLFKVAGYWGWWMAMAVTIAFVVWMLQGRAGQRQTETAGFPLPLAIEDGVLAISMLWLPIFAVAAARITHGGMDERYMQPAILGGALIIGFLSSKAPAWVRPVLLTLMIASYTLASVRDVQTVVTTGSLYSRRTAAAHAMDGALGRSADLPLVISSGLQYLPMAYYHSADQNRRIYALTDPPAAVKFASSDSVDLGLLILRRYYSMHVEDYPTFATKHREFLLFSSGLFDWWPARLLSDGQTLTLLSEDRNGRLYKVVLKQ